jgi:hypothetical protein
MCKFICWKCKFEYVWFIYLSDIMIMYGGIICLKYRVETIVFL